ncbi:hypothetical protein BDB01DRAFT_802764 [Pilobolus umbonatus]|nr:hypothetical protein BDB01DRAFT_802764 [Pilobolus umbonatus]
MSNKPSLPSIKDLLEGGPGILDYSTPRRTHRRHASEHIISKRPTNMPFEITPSLPSSSSQSATTSPLLNGLEIPPNLPFEMQSLSLTPRRTHSRSLSDFTYPANRTPNNTQEHVDHVDTDNIKHILHTPTIGAKYSCPYCNKRFTRPSSLRTHTYSHTGEKPFKCTEPCCGRQFSVQSNLRRHIRIHKMGKSMPVFLNKNMK